MTEALEATEKKTVEVVSYEMTVRLMVDVPVKDLEQYGKPLDEMHESEILDIIGENTDRVPDALSKLFEDGDFTTSYVDLDEWQGPHEVEALEPVRFVKPPMLEQRYYTLPIPNFISGNVRFTDEGMEFVEESSVNKLNDDQLNGAYFAARRVWGLRGMHRYQQEQIAEFLSELQWGMLARPSLHQFSVNQAEIIDDFAEQVCKHCGQGEPGHLVRP